MATQMTPGVNQLRQVTLSARRVALVEAPSRLGAPANEMNEFPAIKSMQVGALLW